MKLHLNLIVTLHLDLKRKYLTKLYFVNFKCSIPTGIQKEKVFHRNHDVPQVLMSVQMTNN